MITPLNRFTCIDYNTSYVLKFFGVNGWKLFDFLIKKRVISPKPPSHVIVYWKCVVRVKSLESKVF